MTKLKGVKEGLSFSDLLLLAEASSDWSEAAAAVTLRSRRDGSVVDGFGRGRVRKEEEMGAAAMAWGLRGGGGRRKRLLSANWQPHIFYIYEMICFFLYKGEI